MSEPSDKTLVRCSAAGDERAFVALVRRYEQPLAARIRYQIGNPDHAEDVLQETLLDAWVGLRRLREPASVRAWLLRIAGNRCNDYFRSPQRRDLTIAHPDLEHLVNRHGRAHVRQQEAVADVVEALNDVPAAERDAARLFYLEGLTIAEIAARSRTPEGTIKWRLHDARHHLRETLGVTRAKEDQMSTRKKGSKKQPFPIRRPDITITRSRTKPFAVDCRELPWWFGVPEVGDRTLWTIYDPPGWGLASVTEMHAVRPADIHGVACVEIDVADWAPKTGWTPSAWTMHGRLTDDTVQWLATSRLQDGMRKLRTFLDEDFGADWGPPSPRRIEDTGQLVRQKDGAFRLKRGASGPLGAGVFNVKIGTRRFTCLRVFDVEAEPSETQELVEAYLARSGRTVLFRRYNGRLWKTKDKPPWDERLPDHNRVVINSATFVHWYDCLTDLACGISED